MIKMLHNPDEALVKKALMRLHVRWWHATSEQLSQTLRAAGSPARARLVWGNHLVQEQGSIRATSKIILAVGAREEMHGVEVHASKKVYQVEEKQGDQLVTLLFRLQVHRFEKFCPIFRARVQTQQEVQVKVGLC